MASKDQVFEFARQEAIRQGVSPDLIVNMVKTESGGRIDAKSNKGAIGPMQLMPATAKELGVDINNWQDNIRGGVKYINQMMRQFNDPVLAVAAYNAGPGNVRKSGGVPEFKETQNYVKKVLGTNMAREVNARDLGLNFEQQGQQSTQVGYGREVNAKELGLKFDQETTQAAQPAQPTSGRELDAQALNLNFGMADQPAPVQQQQGQGGSNLTRSLLDLGRQIAQNSRPGGFIGNPDVTIDRQAGIANQIGRQAGLFGRMGIEGVGTALDIGGAPMANLINMATGSQTVMSPSASMARIADAIGLPKPQGQFEESIMNIGKTGVSAMSGVGAGRLLAGPVTTGLSGMTRTQAVGTGLATQPGAQLAGAGTGATAVEGARNVLDVQDPYALFAIGLLGNVAGAGTASRLGNVQSGTQYRDPTTGQLIEAGRARGVSVEAGDVGTGGGTMRTLRGVAGTAEENLGKRQSEVTRLIDRTATAAQPSGVKAGTETKAIANDLRSQYRTAKQNVSPLFDQAQKLAGDQPIVTTRSAQAVTDVKSMFPETAETNRLIQNINRIDKYAGTGGTYKELRDLQKVVGDELAKVQKGVATGSYSESQVSALSRLYGSLDEDVAAWAAPRQINGKPVYTPAGAAHERAMEQFRQTVAPFRQDQDIYRVVSSKTRSEDYDRAATTFANKLTNNTETANLSMNLMSDKGQQAAQFKILNDARSAALAADPKTPSIDNFNNSLKLGLMDNPTPQRVILSRNPGLLDEVSTVQNVLNTVKPSMTQQQLSPLLPIAGRGAAGTVIPGAALAAGVDPMTAGALGTGLALTAPRGFNLLDELMNSPTGTRFMLGQPNLGTAGATGIAAQQLNPMGNEMPGNVLDLVVNPTIIPRGR
jgi:hypothetical protein